MQRLLVLASFFCIAISERPAWAWNDVGHMTVARIAYDRLTDGERAAIGDMLRHHPHLHELLLKDRPAHASEIEWAFLRAATWPDNVRPPHGHGNEPVSSHSIYRFHHATWHYANFEYRPGQRQTALPNHPLPPHPLPANPAERTDVIEQLDRSYLILRGREYERSEPEVEFTATEIKAIRLCWLMHLIGDIHQPLHVTTLVDPRVPLLQHGDDGGNKLAIRLNHTSAPKKLHAVWDDLLGSNSHFDRIVRLAEKISHDPQLSESSLSEFTSHKYAWEFAQESYVAAKEVIYQNGQAHFASWSKVESHEVQPADVPVMSEQSLDHAHGLAERRVALAGYRLADRLRFILSRGGNRTDSATNAAFPTRMARPSPRSFINE